MRLLLIFSLFLAILPGCLTSDQDEPEEILGAITVALPASKSDVRLGEALIGNFITDAMISYANGVNWKVNEQPIQFALINGGTIRIDKDKYPEEAYPAGEFTNYMIDEMLPFEDTIVLAEVTGTQLKQIFERSVSDIGDQGGQFLQVSQGIKVIFDPSKNKQISSTTGTPEIITPGERILSIQINDKEYLPEGKYRLITNQYIGTGGDGYIVFQNLPDARVLNITLFDILSKYLKDNPSVTPQLEGRLTKPSGSDIGMVNATLIATELTLGTEETLIGNMIADSMVFEAQKNDPDVIGAMVNAGNIHQGTYPSGGYTDTTLQEMLPYNTDNKLVIVTLTGAELKSVLERSVASLSDPANSFMQLSSKFKITVNANNQAQVLDGKTDSIATPGERITALKVDGVDVDTSNIEKTYKIVFSEYIAGGGDGFMTLKKTTIPKTILETTSKKGLEAYIRANSPFAPTITGRIMNYIGEVTVDLIATDENLGTKETVIGNMITDSMVIAAKTVDADTVAAMIPGGQIAKDTYMHGDYTKEMLPVMIPNENPLVIVTLTGTELKAVLEHSVAALPEASLPFMQVSGQLKIVVDPTKQAEVLNDDQTAITTPGERISILQISGIDMVVDTQYKIVFPKETADGGLGYVTLLDLDEAFKNLTDLTVKEAIESHIKINTPLTPVIDNRLVITGR